jgi:hypothetical protein
MSFEYSLGGKWLELLKEVAPAAVHSIKSGLMQRSKKYRYSITSSARSWNSRLIVSPSVCAVLRLTSVGSFARLQ